MVEIYIEKNFVIGEPDARLFSSFLEHMGRAIYTGIYEPDHPLADQDGFRTDVLDLIKELNVEAIRYPGGNFLSGYRWEDGIGPKEDRPRRLDLAWRTIESNQFGIDEFVDWSQKSGTEIIAAVNMGTGTPQDAANMVEYCNFPKGTHYSDLRIKNGHEEPYNIKVWCIGNEMDGPWQTCHLDADDYGKKARETAKMMKWIDPSIQLVVAGSSSKEMPTYPEWDRIVLEYTYEHVDYLSMHCYYYNKDNDLDFLASYASMDQFIKALCATADYVKELKRSDKVMYFSFDEWNIWYQNNIVLRDWIEAPDILEDQYSLIDALAFGGLTTSLLNNCDRVRIGCLAQLVNVIAPIFTQKNGAVFKQTIFYPFKDFATYGRGAVLKPVIQCDTIKTIYGDVNEVAVSVIDHAHKNKCYLLILNCNLHKSVDLDLKFSGYHKAKIIKHQALFGDDLHAVNSFKAPDNITPKNMDISAETSAHLKAASWNVITIQYG